jgi:hypothetical protein
LRLGLRFQVQQRPILQVLAIDPRGALAHLLGIHVRIALVHARHPAAVSVSVLDVQADSLRKDHGRQGLLGAVAVGLFALWGVDFRKPDLDLLLGGGEARQGVAVVHAHHAAVDRFGKGEGREG